MDTLAERVRTRRKKLGLTQGAVAKIAGLKQPDVSKIERGDIQETTKMLGLARALKCNPDWLEYNKGPVELYEAVSHQVNEPRVAYKLDAHSTASWPFQTVTPNQYALLKPAETEHIEKGILMLIQSREPPSNQHAPAPGAAAA